MVAFPLPEGLPTWEARQGPSGAGQLGNCFFQSLGHLAQLDFCEAVSTVDETLVPSPKRAGFYAMAIGFDLYPFNHILGVRCPFLTKIKNLWRIIPLKLIISRFWPIPIYMWMEIPTATSALGFCSMEGLLTCICLSSNSGGWWQVLASKTYDASGTHQYRISGFPHATPSNISESYFHHVAHAACIYVIMYIYIVIYVYIYLGKL